MCTLGSAKRGVTLIRGRGSTNQQLETLGTAVRSSRPQSA